MSGMWVTRSGPRSAEGLDHTAQESHLHEGELSPSWLLNDSSILALGEWGPVLSFLSQLVDGTRSWMASFSSLQAGKYPETRQPSQSQSESWGPSEDQGGHNPAKALMVARGPGSPAGKSQPLVGGVRGLTVGHAQGGWWRKVTGRSAMGLRKTAS